MTLSLMPKDLPLPIDVNNGVFVPATAEDVSQAGPDGLTAWDPWTHANLAVMADDSLPFQDPYGEPYQAKAASIVAEWGGMPSPVKSYLDMAGSVLLVRRPVKDFSGPTGQFNGPQQTAWEASYTDPTTDYWSVIIGS